MEKNINCLVKASYFKIAATVFLTIAISTLTLKFLGPIPFSVTQITTQKSSTFDVSASAKKTIVPTTAKVVLGIETKANTVLEAQNQANETMNKIISELKSTGVDKDEIKTTRYNLYPNYDYQNGRKINGFIVSISLEVKTKKFDKINKIIDTATLLGANQIGQLSFDTEDEELESIKMEAREEAIKKASKKAKEIAKIGGLKLGKIINITEDQALPYPVYREASFAVGGKDIDEQTQIQPGETEVVVNVTLSFETL